MLVDPYVLIVPADSPLAGRPSSPTLREIADQPLIGYQPSRSMDAIEASIRRAGREPNIVFRSDDNPTVQALVGAGVGIALVPRLTLLPTDPSVPCEHKLTVGDAATAICEVAENDNVDLIVMGVSGRTGLLRWFTGSVTDDVARDAPCSVLLVKPTRAPVAAEEKAAEVHKEPAVEPAAVQGELQPPGGDAVGDRGAAFEEVVVGPLVPEEDVAGAVLPLGDGPGE